jgi:hypothetical protein
MREKLLDANAVPLCLAEETVHEANLLDDFDIISSGCDARAAGLNGDAVPVIFREIWRRLQVPWGRNDSTFGQDFTAGCWRTHGSWRTTIEPCRYFAPDLIGSAPSPALVLALVQIVIPLIFEAFSIVYRRQEGQRGADIAAVMRCIGPSADPAPIPNYTDSMTR